MSPRRKRPIRSRIDWVELGCRGWEIDHTGAEFTRGDDYAHLDRQMCDLLFSGHRRFVARAINDLIAAGLLRITEPRSSRLRRMWSALPETSGTSSMGSNLVTVKFGLAKPSAA